MEMRRLGSSGLQVSALGFGTMTFGGDRRRSGGRHHPGGRGPPPVDLCLEAGVNLFDTADVYSQGASEEILGRGARGPARRRDPGDQGARPHGPRPNDIGQSRHHIMRGCEASLKRLGTDYIDLYQVHGFDALTPLEETLRALDDLVRAGKVRYIGCSNYSGWHLMKALGISERSGLERFVSQQVYYSLVGPRARVRAGAAGARPGHRRADLEPAVRRLPARQVPPRAGGAGGHAPVAARRPRHDRRGEGLRRSSTCSKRSPRRTTPRSPRSR